MQFIKLKVFNQRIKIILISSVKIWSYERQKSRAVIEETYEIFLFYTTNKYNYKCELNVDVVTCNPMEVKHDFILIINII